VGAPIDTGYACARDDIEPLVGALMTIARAAFRIAGLQDHFGRLRAAVSHDHTKTDAKSEFLTLHVRFAFVRFAII
jgi:hypothetical protein